MSSTRKPKLDYEEQIKKLKSLGILFNEITEEEAKEILKNNTYFTNAYYIILIGTKKEPLKMI